MLQIRRRSVVAGAAMASLARVTQAQGVQVSVEPPCGPVTGQVLGGVAQFPGLPYAAPPVGPLRYASPKPLAPWTEPRLSAVAPASIQTLGGAAAWLYEGGWAQSEDCLTLSVWSPDVRGKHPVMVWLHGGAWRTGRGDAAGTQGAALARAGMVVVTVNYRLGALGWLAHPGLQDAETGAFANWGMQDQVAALRWVHANIAAFGGDPGNVTLFGQSAGGSSTASIAQDPGNAGLLHKAIIESGSLHGAPGFPDVATAAAYAEALAKRLDVSVPGLRSLPALQVHQAELQLARDPAMVRSLGRPPVLPVLDGVVLKVWPRDGALPAIPLMIGTTENEAVFWYDLVGPDGKPVPGLPPPKDRAQLISYIRDLTAIYRPEASAIPAERIATAYADAARTRGEPDDALSLWLRAYTDIVFRLRARTAAQRHAALARTYLYEFQRPLAAPAHGVPHTSEIVFAFGTYDDPFFAGKTGGEDAAALSALMLHAWAEFARSGAPGEGWQPVTADETPVNCLGGQGGLLEPRRGVRLEELAAWES